MGLSGTGLFKRQDRALEIMILGRFGGQVLRMKIGFLGGPWASPGLLGAMSGFSESMVPDSGGLEARGHDLRSFHNHFIFDGPRFLTRSTIFYTILSTKAATRSLAGLANPGFCGAHTGDKQTLAKFLARFFVYF